MALVDLSQPVADGMPVYPGSRPVAVDEAATVDREGARVTELALDTHAGTHVDAPAHTLADGATLETFAPGDFEFDAHRVDCTGLDPREPIGREALPERTDHDLLAIHTGWSEHWGTERYRDHPYLTEPAAAWCGEHGYSVGLDTFGPDPTPSADPRREREGGPAGYPAHDALFAGGNLLVENLTGLDRVPEEFRLTAYPLALDAEASPVRAVAQW